MVKDSNLDRPGQEQCPLDRLKQMLTGQCTYIVALRRDSTTTVAMEEK